MKRHLPQPGPSYWEWRCRECGMDVKHPGYHLRWWETVNWGNVALAAYIVIMILIVVFG